MRDWVREGWLTEHRSSPEEIRNLLGLADRDLRASQLKELYADWRFAIAYNAALQAATAALAAAGYRAAREAHHLRVIGSLEFTIRADPELIRQFNAFRKKRNISSYERGGSISDVEAKGMRTLATKLRSDVERWIGKNHPELL
ncbi:MAG TPA: hypothetical protein VJW51_07610 [Candidatus Acidoferrales bacterium]|nr:hypothetical protein [Candidatus Acidoferrales bacterium]